MFLWRLIILLMPRTSKFDRDRISKLFGERTKPIHKEGEQKVAIKSSQLFQKKENDGKKPNNQGQMIKENENHRAFKSFSYCTMNKVFNIPHRGQQVQKLNFRCYNDNDIFGEDYMDFLKKNHDQDHETPPQQVRFDVSVGIKRLKEGIDTYINPENDGASSVRSHGSKGLLRYQSVHQNLFMHKKH